MVDKVFDTPLVFTDVAGDTVLTTGRLTSLSLIAPVVPCAETVVAGHASAAAGGPHNHRTFGQNSVW